jgi:dephospho-CoA kinase
VPADENHPAAALMLTVGLTGGIASGKSLAVAAFRALGAPVIEGDQVAREVVAKGQPALEEIRTRYGDEFLLPDGTLNRRKLRELVFADEAALRDLDAITHPRIRARLLAWRDAQTAPYGLLDVPILIESGMDALVQRILVVDAPVEVQLARLMARDKIPEKLGRQMLSAQAERTTRLARADDVITNSGDMADVSRAVQQLHELYLALAAGAPRPAHGLRLP